jgi:hypothetical protein
MASQSSKEKQQKENTQGLAPKLEDWSLKAGQLVLVDDYKIGLVAEATPGAFTYARIYHNGQLHLIHTHRIRRM